MWSRRAIFVCRFRPGSRGPKLFTELRSVANTSIIGTVEWVWLCGCIWSPFLFNDIWNFINVYNHMLQKYTIVDERMRPSDHADSCSTNTVSKYRVDGSSLVHPYSRPIMGRKMRWQAYIANENIIGKKKHSYRIDMSIHLPSRIVGWFFFSLPNHLLLWIGPRD